MVLVRVIWWPCFFLFGEYSLNQSLPPAIADDNKVIKFIIRDGAVSELCGSKVKILPRTRQIMVR